MGKLMKDVPATRYNLLDRGTPEQRHAELLRHFEEDARSPEPAPYHLSPAPAPIYKYRSTAEELEIYLRSAYGR